MRGVKPAEYAKHLLSEGGRTEFLLNETTVLKTLSRLGGLFLVVATLLIFPGMFYWSDLFCDTSSWDYCRAGTMSILEGGFLTVTYFFLSGIGLYYSAMLLENVIAIRNNTEKKETE
jgi:hypothetical protein|tara:strand:+ start:211 stop:561 length:351 start_codon:yes stop_codon:yes gene_type:complete